MKYDYEPKVFVTCGKCKREFNENKITDIESIGISENEVGQDELSFKCPYCNHHTTSLRYTKR